MARPSKFSREVAEKILDALRAGNTNEAAAEFAGISPSTFYDWRRQGREGHDPELVWFEAECRKALGSAEVRFEAVIATAALKGDWRASAWWLTHFPGSQWGARQPELPPGHVEVTVVWPEQAGHMAEGPYQTHTPTSGDDGDEAGSLDGDEPAGNDGEHEGRPS